MSTLSDMSHNEQSRFERMQERYRNRELPWDHALPPPEIMAIPERLPPGKVLDLGCGTARASIYLAARGWESDAVDFVPEAIELARERVLAAGLKRRIHLHVGTVTDLHFLSGPYDLALDVGCFHGLDSDDQQRYAQELARLLRPGGLYLLFVHLYHPGQEAIPASAPRGSVESAFTKYFDVLRVEYGETAVLDKRWDSAWYELQRFHK